MDPPLIKDNSISLTGLSIELICEIINYLPLREMVALQMQCKKLHDAVILNLNTCKKLNFATDEVFGTMPVRMNDDIFFELLKKCHHLEYINNLNPVSLKSRHLRHSIGLTKRGIVNALHLCTKLKGIETNNMKVVEAVIEHFPWINVSGNYYLTGLQSTDMTLPKFKLFSDCNVNVLRLTGVKLSELPSLENSSVLYLEEVCFTSSHPFVSFSAPKLNTFVMRHCSEPPTPIRYAPLVEGLSKAVNLNRLELVGLSMLGGLLSRHVEESWRQGGFCNLKSLVIAGCKNITESAVGPLMLISSKRLQYVKIQPLLTRDTFFVSLTAAEAKFPLLQDLHLGYIDELFAEGEVRKEFAGSYATHVPAPLTDTGLSLVALLCPELKTLSVDNCHHILDPTLWYPQEAHFQMWQNLENLSFSNCHCLCLENFGIFLQQLTNLKVLSLESMFREPPKGCSHIGLGTGTGLTRPTVPTVRQEELQAMNESGNEPGPSGVGNTRGRNKSGSRSKIFKDKSKPEPPFKDQVCQASSEDIQSEMASGKIFVRRHKTRSHSRKNAGKADKPGTSQKKTSGKKTKDVATSTCDPLLEDDAVLKLIVKLSSLESLFMSCCGVSDLILEEVSPTRFSLYVEASRNFKYIDLAPALSTYLAASVMQCPKFKLKECVDTVDKGLCIGHFFYEPLEMNLDTTVEEIIFKRDLTCHHILMEEESPEGDRGMCILELETWIKEFNRILRSLMEEDSGMNATSEKVQMTEKYPWHYTIKKIYGKIPGQCYKLVTDNPFFAELYSKNVDGTFSLGGDASEKRKWYQLAVAHCVENHVKFMKRCFGFCIHFVRNDLLEELQCS